MHYISCSRAKKCNIVQMSHGETQEYCNALVSLGLSVRASCRSIHSLLKMKPEVCKQYCVFLYFPWYTEKVCIIFCKTKHYR